jgi:hypothetical protein
MRNSADLPGNDKNSQEMTVFGLIERLSGSLVEMFCRFID